MTIIYTQFRKKHFARDKIKGYFKNMEHVSAERKGALQASFSL